MSTPVPLEGAPRGVPTETLDALLSAEPAAWLRRVAGRETFAWTLATGREVVVKRARELRRPWRASAGEREHANLRGLASDGVPVPRALGWREDRDGKLTRRSLVVMERIEHDETLRERLFRAGAAERRALARELLALVVALHAAGWYHRDLYLQHVVVSRRGLVLLDVGRARRESAPARRWLVKDLAALLHSTPRSVTGRERLRFLAGWLDARGVRSRAERRSWLGGVLAKQRRIAAHAPRAGETRPWTDR